MRRFHNILFVSHGIGNEEDTLRQALKLSYDNKASLSILIVCPPVPQPLKEYEASYEASLLDNMQKAVKAAQLALGSRTLPIKITLECDVAPDVRIIRHVLQHAHDLLIKATELNENSKGFRALDMELLRKCPCALFLSRPLKHAQQKAYVAVAIDPKDDDPAGTSLSLTLLEIAHSLAKNGSGYLDVVSCWHFPFEEYFRENIWIKTSENELKQMIADEEKLNMEALQALMKATKLNDEDYQLHHLKGRPEQQIPTFIEEQVIDILVMGTVARTGITGFIIGNTAENILQKIDCSLLALKPPGFVSPV
ncbi:universal stress protein [Legionella oakridgensis]|uniref:universal stress protein n=1 Tax=Legionella oakridgensis TaxID=29423 RepID=UPI0003DE30C2|nr:universal stress protein [Legionella oakridgensis]ETO93386.1 universal stress protein UspA [Legionella oakridgensis RV-2-2007]